MEFIASIEYRLTFYSPCKVLLFEVVNILIIRILQRLLLKCFYHSRKEECSSERASNQERVDFSISKLSPLLRQNCENKMTNSILYPVSLVDIWTKASCQLLTLENVSIQTQNRQIKILLICILHKKYSLSQVLCLGRVCLHI